MLSLPSACAVAGILFPTTRGTAASLPVGTRVMGLVAGGGNAEFAVVNERHLLRVPPALDFRTAAAIPETWLTAYQLLHLVGHVQAADTVLVHAAASGVGTAAIQLSRAAGARVLAVAGSDEKLDYARSLGAAAAFNYKSVHLPYVHGLRAVLRRTDQAASLCTPQAFRRSSLMRMYRRDPAFAARVVEATGGKGATLILDPVGGSFWQQNVDALATGG